MTYVYFSGTIIAEDFLKFIFGLSFRQEMHPSNILPMENLGTYG
jgi:hypothetical protein